MTIVSHMTKYVSVFVKSDTIFRLFFFWKLPQIGTSNFHKIVRQHTKGMVGSNMHWFYTGFTLVLLDIYFSFQQ